jgi:hypothetical protein
MKVLASQGTILQDREFPDPLAGSCEDRIAKRGSDDGDSRFSYSCRRSGAVNYVNVRLKRRVRDAGDPIIMEIRLLNDAVTRGDLAAQRDARSEHSRALQLRSDVRRINGYTCVYSGVNPGDSDLSFIRDFHLDHGRNVAVRVAMDRNSEATPFAKLPSTPARLFGCKFRDPAQTPMSRRYPGS